MWLSFSGLSSFGLSPTDGRRSTGAAATANDNSDDGSLSDPLSDFLRAAPAQRRPDQSYQISLKYLIKYLRNVLSNILWNISLNKFLRATPARCRDQSYQVVFVWVNKVFSLWQFISLSIISFSKSNYQYPPLRSVVKAIATVNIDWVSERNQLN